MEDTPDVARYIAAQMNPSFSYYFAANGKEALAKAEELVPDLIITDVMMPEMDGFELTEQIRKSAIIDHVPVIMVTARATHDDRLKGLEAGATHTWKNHSMPTSSTSVPKNLWHNAL